MDKVSVLQQLYVNQGQFIIGKSPEKMVQQQPTYCMHFILSTFLGILICGVALSSLLTLYLKQKSCTSQSTATTISMTIITTTTNISQTTQMNQTNSSIAATQAYYCAGVSSYTLWQLFSTDGITMTIDTSSCNYNSTPLYFTSMAGITNHWSLAGYTAIYVPSKSSFTVYALSLTGMTNTAMLSWSQTYQWSVNWFGVSN